MEQLKKIYSGIINSIKGMIMVGRHFQKKPITIEYPEEKDNFNSRLRGHIAILSNEDGSINCIDCKNCMRSCPCDDLIKITSHKEENQTIIESFSIDLGRCIVCGNCVEACPKNVLAMNDDYSLGCYDKKDLVWDLDKLKLSPKKTQELLAKKEME